MSEQKNITMYGRTTVGGGQQPFGTIDTGFRTIYNDLIKFRQVFRDSSAGIADQLFFDLDQPGHYYFKLFFYFDNPYADPDNPLSSNLLGTQYEIDDATSRDLIANTALSYLYNNMEYTRFNNLTEFIQLLSDVSTKSPWYFQQISGLDTAIERNEISERDFKIDEQRKSITIKCLPDAYDNRIGRLLDLYRSIVYSQSLHKWILPSNLRKFDMGIYIFNSPIKTISGGRYGVVNYNGERTIGTGFREYTGNRKEDVKSIGFYKRNENGLGQMLTYAQELELNPTDLNDNDTAVASKYIELRGCEIDYNSSKSVYSELDNAEGKANEYEIVIKFDTASEDRYDPVFRRYIGDFVLEDLMNGEYTYPIKEDPYEYVSPDGRRDFTLGENSQVFTDGQGRIANSLAKGVIGNYSFGVTDRNSSEDISTLNNNFSGRNYRYTREPDNTRNNLIEAVAQTGSRIVNTYANRLLMGNIYGLSFGKLDILATSDPMSAIKSVGRGINNARLIQKRISDFTKPDKGRDMLAGKSLYNGWSQSSVTGDLDGQTFINLDKDHRDVDWSLKGKNLYGDNEPTNQSAR